MIGTKVSGNKSKKYIYILMELANDSLIKMLQRKLDSKSTFSESEILNIFLQICIGVSQLHGENPPIIHRDLKVENVLSIDGKFKVCDFGSCTTRENQRDISEAELDIQQNTTLPYRSPEMADLYGGHTINEKSDIWALGCILYKMCFFYGPFEEASNLQIMNGNYKIPTSPKYSDKMINLIKFCLVVDPKNRPDVFDVIQKVEELKGEKISIQKPQRNSVQEEVKKPEKKQEIKTPTKKQPPNENSLFGMLDWNDNDGKKEIQKVENDDWAKFEEDPWGEQKEEPKIQNNTPKKIESQKKPQVKKEDLGNDLFSQLDWKDNDSSKHIKPTHVKQPSLEKVSTKPKNDLFSNLEWNEESPKKTNIQKISNPKNNRESIGNDLFGQLDWNEPKPTIQHIRGPSFDTKQEIKHSKQPSGSDLFGQLDWNESKQSPQKSSDQNSFKQPQKSNSGLFGQLDWNDTQKQKLSTPISHIRQPSGNDLLTIGDKDPFSTLSHSRQSSFNDLSHAINLRLWISKATSSKKEGISIKYASKLIYELHESKKDMIVFLRSRPILSNAIVCFKTLILIHMMIQQGPKSILDKLIADSSIFQDIKEVWSSLQSNDKELTQLIVDYSIYLLSRVSFSKKNPNFEGNFSLNSFISSFSSEKELSLKIGKYSPLHYDTCSDLNLLQNNLFEFMKLNQNKNYIKNCWNLLLQDSENSLLTLSFIIQKLNPLSSSRLEKISEDFNLLKKKFDGFIKVDYQKEVSTFKPNKNEDPDSDCEETLEVEAIISLQNQIVTMEECLKVPGNDFCTECRSKNPNCVSMNYGIFICPFCSGVHKSLGLSKVRSLTLDKWSPEQIQFLYLVGNKRSNRYWEATLQKSDVPSTKDKITPFIESKYLKKKWRK